MTFRVGSCVGYIGFMRVKSIMCSFRTSLTMDQKTNDSGGPNYLELNDHGVV